MSYFSIGLPMPRPWGPPSMMYSSCPPWAGWYGPRALPPMHFHPGWPGSAGGFDHGGYYIRDGHHGSVGQQQDKGGHMQENRIV
jgi:hypothetical protein